MNKKALSESDICDRFISPALIAAGWDETRWRREYPFTAGRIIVRGELIARGKQKRADYLLFYKSNIPIAVIEARILSQQRRERFGCSTSPVSSPKGRQSSAST